MPYANIDGKDTELPSPLRKLVWDNLGEFIRYLERAKKAFEQTRWFVEWKPLSKEYLKDWILSEGYEYEGIDVNIWGEKILREKGFWVQLIELEKLKWRENMLEEFIDADYLYDQQPPFNAENQINILKTLRDIDAVLLERKPKIGKDGERLLYLKPNTWPLWKEIEAIKKLQNQPHPSQRGLLRLLEPRNKAEWNQVDEVESEEWFVLKNEEFPGTKEQRHFVKIALGTPDFAFLEGPPGSGKTMAITELILQLINRGKRVLLCASTHVAVDNVLERLVDCQEIMPVRVGKERKISPTVIKYCLDKWRQTKAKEIEKGLANKKDLLKSQKRQLKQIIFLENIFNFF